MNHLAEIIAELKQAQKAVQHAAWLVLELGANRSDRDYFERRDQSLGHVIAKPEANHRTEPLC